MTPRQPISFIRATPPALPSLQGGVRVALEDIEARLDADASLFRQHRFDGTELDKACAARWLSQRLPIPPADRILVTNGTMNSLLILMATVVGPQGVLATEAMTFPQVKTLAALFGIRLVGIECDEQGLRPDALEDACRSGAKPVALYVQPTIQSPTATVMPLARRQDIADVARRHHVMLIEDEAQALYAQDVAPPIASLAPESAWYLMGLSKYLSLGMRAAFVVAPSASAAKDVLARVRTLSTWHVAPLVAELVTRWIRNETAHALFSAARDELHARQALVREVFGDLTQFRGSHGLHFWLEAPTGYSGEDFTRAAGDAGVLVRPSELYAVSSCTPGIRPAIGDSPDREALLDGLRTLRAVFDRLATHSRVTKRGA
jgi:DNA-binding transcriptional MocR family regulator